MHENAAGDGGRLRLAHLGALRRPRLQEIKGRYDPDNVFHGNANIRPLATTP